MQTEARTLAGRCSMPYCMVLCACTTCDCGAMLLCGEVDNLQRLSMTPIQIMHEFRRPATKSVSICDAAVPLLDRSYNLSSSAFPIYPPVLIIGNCRS